MRDNEKLFYEKQGRQAAMTSGQVGSKCRVWGGSPTSRFSDFGRREKFEKRASVATLALLAV